MIILAGATRRAAGSSSRLFILFRVPCATPPVSLFLCFRSVSVPVGAFVHSRQHLLFAYFPICHLAVRLPPRTAAVFSTGLLVQLVDEATIEYAPGSSSDGSGCRASLVLERFVPVSVCDDILSRPSYLNSLD